MILRRLAAGALIAALSLPPEAVATKVAAAGPSSSLRGWDAALAAARPSLRSHRRLQAADVGAAAPGADNAPTAGNDDDEKEEEDDDNNGNGDDDDDDEKEDDDNGGDDNGKGGRDGGEARVLSLDFSLLAVDPATGADLQRGPLAAATVCAATNLLCLATDWNLTDERAGDDAEDPCRAARSIGVAPRLPTGGADAAAAPAAVAVPPAYVDAEPRHRVGGGGVSYFAVTLGYAVVLEDGADDTADLAAVAQAAADAAARDGTLDMLLGYCQREVGAAVGSPPPVLHSSVPGREVATFGPLLAAAAAAAAAAADEQSSWSAWFADPNRVIAVAVAGAALLITAALLLLAVCYRRDRKGGRHAKASLSRPVPLTKAGSAETTPQSDRGSGNDEEVELELDIYRSTAQVLGIPGHGSDSSVTCDHAEDDFSLADERDYENETPSLRDAYNMDDMSMGTKEFEFVADTWVSGTGKGNASVTDASLRIVAKRHAHLPPSARSNRGRSIQACSSSMNRNPFKFGHSARSRSDAPMEYGSLAIVRSQSASEQDIFREAVDNKKFHAIDLDSGIAMPLESAASF